MKRDALQSHELSIIQTKAEFQFHVKEVLPSLKDKTLRAVFWCIKRGEIPKLVNRRRKKI